MARISVDELFELQRQGTAPVIIDLRSSSSNSRGQTPGAVVLSVQDLEAMTLNISAGDEVVVYCTCPNEASAARVAKQLMRNGYSRVRPLAVGIDAWITAGYRIVP